MRPFITKCGVFVLLAFFSTACIGDLFSNSSNKPLNIGCYNNDSLLLAELIKKYALKETLINDLDKSTEEKIIKSLLDGSLDLFVGRLNIPEEYSEQIESDLAAKDALVIVVNKTNKVDNITKEQLRKIFKREINNWKTLQGANEPILIVDREESSVERQTIYHELFENGGRSISPSITVSNLSEVNSAITKYPNALSYVSFANMDSSQKAVLVDNIPANRENISEGYFPLTRELRVYFNPEKLKANKKYESVQKFLGFLYTKGQEVTAQVGYMPLTATEIELIHLEADPMYIGVAAPLEGPYGDLGRSIVNAAKLAVEEANKLTVEGRPIALMVCNDKGTVKGAITCANKFTKAKVYGVIGHLTSKDSIEASKIYAEKHIVQITPSATHPWFTERPGARGYVFRTVGRDDQQARLISDLIISLPNKVHPIKVNVFNNGTIYGSTLSTLIERELAKSPAVKFLGINSVVQDSAQYHKEVQPLKCDVLVFIGEPGDAAQIVKELALNGKQGITFIGADGIFSQAFIDSAGERAEGAYVTGSAFSSNEAVDEFNMKFKERFQANSSPFAMNSYDATNILINAIRASVEHSCTVNEEVAKAHYEGVTGLISFNSIGDTIQPRMAIYQVVNGEFVKHDKFSYSENR